MRTTVLFAFGDKNPSDLARVTALRSCYGHSAKRFVTVNKIEPNPTTSTTNHVQFNFCGAHAFDRMPEAMTDNTVELAMFDFVWWQAGAINILYGKDWLYKVNTYFRCCPTLQMFILPANQGASLLGKDPACEHAQFFALTRLRHRRLHPLVQSLQYIEDRHIRTYVRGQLAKCTTMWVALRRSASGQDHTLATCVQWLRAYAASGRQALTVRIRIQSRRGNGHCRTTYAAVGPDHAVPTQFQRVPPCAATIGEAVAVPLAVVGVPVNHQNASSPTKQGAEALLRLAVLPPPGPGMVRVGGRHSRRLLIGPLDPFSPGRGKTTRTRRHRSRREQSIRGSGVRITPTEHEYVLGLVEAIKTHATVERSEAGTHWDDGFLELNVKAKPLSPTAQLLAYMQYLCVRVVPFTLRQHVKTRISRCFINLVKYGVTKWHYDNVPEQAGLGVAGKPAWTVCVHVGTDGPVCLLATEAAGGATTMRVQLRSRDAYGLPGYRILHKTEAKPPVVGRYSIVCFFDVTRQFDSVAGPMFAYT